MFRLTLLFLVGYVSIFEASGQTLTFKHITVENGLSQNSVRAICQDSLGYIWFGTQNGLNRYNGYEIEIFESNKNDTLSLPSNFIYTLCSSSKGQLWIGTNHGLCLWDQPSAQFLRMDNYFSNTNYNRYNFYEIIIDSKGSVWTMAEGKGIHLFRKDKYQTRFEEILFLNESIGKGPPDADAQLLEDHQGNIWVATGRSGLWKLEPKEKQFIKILIDGKNEYSITAIAQDRGETIWVGTHNNGLFQYNLASKTFAPVEGLNDQAIKSMYVDLQGRIWVGTDQGGLNLYNRDSRTFTYYDHNVSNPGSLLHNSVTSIFQDRQNILWIGTYAGGVNYSDPATGTFQLYQAGPDNRKNLSNNIVTGFAEDRKGNIWIGTDRGGLNYFDRTNNSFRHYRNHHGTQHSISSDIIKHVLVTSRDQVWVATWLGGLNYFDHERNQFHTYSLDNNNSNSISSNTINYLFEDSKKNLWLGTPIGLDFIDKLNLTKVNPPEINARHFKNNEADQASLSNNYVSYIYEDRENKIWVGTREGLNLLDPSSGIINNYHHNPESKKLFTNDYIQCITQTKEGDFLIGTYENGLLHYKTNVDSLFFYNKSTGFPSNGIIGILEGSDGNSWISTTNGLVKFHAATHAYTLYNKDDGLQSNEFKENAYYRLRSGEMLFGGTNGFNLFHPDSILKNTVAPVPLITKFKLFNNTISPGVNSTLKRDISTTRKIFLNYNESFIGFEFTALNLTLPHKNQYAYMLKGIDTEWNYVGNQRSANYSYIPPGEYTFKVKAANNDGVWNENPVELIVIINPPWWNTLWFTSVIVLGVITLIWSVFKLRTRQLYERKKILEETVKIRTNELQQTNELLSERQHEIKTQRDNLEQQYNTIQSLSEIGQKITASIKQEELIRQMYTIINKLMDASLFSIGYYNHEKQLIEFSTLRRDSATIEDDLVGMHENRLSVWCLKNKETLLLCDVQDFVSKHLAHMGDHYLKEVVYRSAIYLPIQSANQEATEILIVKSHSKNSFAQVHLNTLKNLTAYIAIAFDNARVYKEIEAQSEVLMKQSAKLEELDRMKTRFFINISHEFRTPLTLIVSPLEQMLRQKTIDDWPRMHRQLMMMNKNANQLLRLINELLEIRNIESGGSIALSAFETDIVAFTSGIIARFEELASHHNLRFNILSESAKILLWFDNDMMEKVLVNLYSNACKYTPSGGRIDTHLGVEETDGERFAKIVIRDTGIGIPENEIPYLFERFYQGSDPVNHNQESTGIGLSFVKDLVEFHSGKIKVQSKVNGGTTFIILLPLGNAHFEEHQVSRITDEIAEDTVSLTVENSGNHVVAEVRPGLPIILVVEDNRDVRDLLKMEFDDSHHIIEATNGQEGFDLALQHIPDLIISDIMMPVMDGIQLCQLLKSDERTSHIPLVLLTAKSGEASHIKGLGIGADDYIPKPFNIRILHARVLNLITSRKKLHALFSAKEQIEVSNVIENAHDRIFIEKVDRIIKENVKEPLLNHEFVAKEVGMSKTQLYRKLQAITGNSVHEYIRNYRLRCANEILKTNPDILIFELVDQLGFKDHAYFSKCFHALFGMSPQARKKERALMALSQQKKG
jgi:signal transduction histidine kinase/ligand-binding sensor domain-containing protein/DNA-binding response OmpR family regulator